MNDIVAKFEDSMSKYNINTTECMQKALCTYIQSKEQTKEKSGINNFVDSTVNTLIKYEIHLYITCAITHSLINH